MRSEDIWRYTGIKVGLGPLAGGLDAISLTVSNEGTIARWVGGDGSAKAAHRSRIQLQTHWARHCVAVVIITGINLGYAVSRGRRRVTKVAQLGILFSFGVSNTFPHRHRRCPKTESCPLGLNFCFGGGGASKQGSQARPGGPCNSCLPTSTENQWAIASR